MPFIKAWGIPGDTSPEMLAEVEAKLVAALAKAMEVPERTCHAFFHSELSRPQRQPHMIYVNIDTGLFGEGGDEVEKRATQAVAQVLFDGFDGDYSVEVFPVALDGTNKTYLKRDS